MKKLLFILFFCFASSSIYAQITGSSTAYANGDSFGYSVNEVSGAVSYDWSVSGNAQATIWPAWDTAIDLTFSHAGGCIVTCTITLSNSSVLVYDKDIDVYEE
jgi:hypothetical protein